MTLVTHMLGRAAGFGPAESVWPSPCPELRLLEGLGVSLYLYMLLSPDEREAIAPASSARTPKEQGERP